VRTKTSAQADKILQAAGHLFGIKHFHEVRMDDIATEATVGKGTLYRYFPDKEKLYLAVLARASEQYLERIRHALAKQQGPRARLEALVHAIITYFDEQPHLLDLIQRAEVLRAIGTPFPWQEVRERLWALVFDLLEEGKEAGAFEVAAPELAASMLFGGIRIVLRVGKQPRPPNLARQIVDLWLWGVAAACPSR
jgi:TetR/AcrR family fatty acid metabolism transcriptional regulator